nr:MAG: hypothetical protein [Chemarfal virus 79]
MSRTFKEFFITISKYNRGSMNIEEIELSHIVLSSMETEQLLIINEHRNFKGELFEHLHIYVLLVKEKRSDKLRDFLKKELKFIEHSKDLDIRQVPDKETLLGGYLIKCPDRTLIISKGLTDEYLNQCKEKSDINRELNIKFNHPLKKISKNRIYKSDVPYCMHEFIIDNNLSYNGSLGSFTRVIKEMLLKNYDFELRNLVEVKSKLDLIQLGNYNTLSSHIEDQFKFIACPIDDDYIPPTPVYKSEKSNVSSVFQYPDLEVDSCPVWDELKERIKIWN